MQGKYSTNINSCQRYQKNYEIAQRPSTSGAQKTVEMKGQQPSLHPHLEISRDPYRSGLIDNLVDHTPAVICHIDRARFVFPEGRNRERRIEEQTG
jgi:hypothetical protein